MRSLCEWKMPGANPEAFSEVPLVGTRGKTRFGLPELATFRGRNVDEIIARSVSEFLEKSTFNNPGDIEEIPDYIRQDLVWGKVLEKFDDYEQRLVEFIDTPSPSDKGEDIGDEPPPKKRKKPAKRR